MGKDEVENVAGQMNGAATPENSGGMSERTRELIDGYLEPWKLLPDEEKARYIEGNAKELIESSDYYKGGLIVPDCE